MTNPDAIAAAIRAVTAAVHPDQRWKVGPQASIKHDLGLDQIDRLTIACAIDEALGIEIPDHELHRWETIAEVAATAQRLALSAHPEQPKPQAEQSKGPAKPTVAKPNWQALGFAGPEDAEGRN